MVSLDRQFSVKDWTDRDKGIIESKYVHPLDRNEAHRLGIEPLEAVIKRVTTKIANRAKPKHLEVAGFTNNPEGFQEALEQMVTQQLATWNSPVWFNVGIEAEPQVWACLILSVEDSMESIIKWWNTEAECFLGGSGSGVNLSAIRADGEALSGGKGTASGPESFMRAADSMAGSIKSGGRTRRAAKMVILNADHPDIESFINSKAKVERMKKALEAEGFDMGLNGVDAPLIQYQNANISVRVTDEFMQAVERDGIWNLHSIVEDWSQTVEARKLWNSIAEAAWICGDPGVQFDTTINSWHTTPSRGRINASNPCSEYMHVDNSVCNLGSHNLKRYWNKSDGRFSFDLELLHYVTRLMIVSQDILVDMSKYPNEEIERNATELRNLGLGFANLGGLLMAMNVPYDSILGRDVAAGLSSFIMASAVRTSAELASELGTHAAWEDDKETHTHVLDEHRIQAQRWHQSHETSELWTEVANQWSKALDLTEANGQRHAQLTVIAPTGTIGFMLGVETTGVEPLIAIEADKELVGGGSVDVSPSATVNEAIEYFLQREHLDKSELNLDVLLNDNDIFATAIGPNMLRPEAHVYMMAAVQPSISGAISKTAIVPSDATPETIANIYHLAWSHGLKSIAVYRDSSKGDQPVNVRKKKLVLDATEVLDADGLKMLDESLAQENLVEQFVNEARKGGHEAMPGTRPSVTHKYTIEGQDFYLTVGYYPETGKPGEIFLKASAQGSFVSGMCDVFSISVSLGLQHGVTVETFAEHFIHQSFEPHGVVISDSEIKMARSVIDYAFRWIMKEFPQHTNKGVIASDKPLTLFTSEPPTVESTNGTHVNMRKQCPDCKQMSLEFAGTCMRCVNCGYEEGCG